MWIWDCSHYKKPQKVNICVAYWMLNKEIKADEYCAQLHATVQWLPGGDAVILKVR